jgi:hypothetical protein
VTKFKRTIRGAFFFVHVTAMRGPRPVVPAHAPSSLGGTVVPAHASSSLGGADVPARAVVPAEAGIQCAPAAMHALLVLLAVIGFPPPRERRFKGNKFIPDSSAPLREVVSGNAGNDGF